MKKLIVILIFSSCIINYSCMSTDAVAKKITIETNQIPPDMRIEKFGIIGALRGLKSIDKYMENDFEQYYTGSYVLANPNEIKTTYADVNKYRYILDYSSGRMTGSFAYYILDRKTDTKYYCYLQTGDYSKMITSYLKAIEAVRKK